MRERDPDLDRTCTNCGQPASDPLCCGPDKPASRIATLYQAAQVANDLSEDWTNGHRSSVVDILLTMPVQEAIAVTMFLGEYLPTNERASLLLLLLSPAKGVLQ